MSIGRAIDEKTKDYFDLVELSQIEQWFEGSRWAGHDGFDDASRKRKRLEAIARYIVETGGKADLGTIGADEDVRASIVAAKATGTKPASVFG